MDDFGKKAKYGFEMKRKILNGVQMHQKKMKLLKHQGKTFSRRNPLLWRRARILIAWKRQLPHVEDFPRPQNCAILGSILVRSIWELRWK